MTITVASSRYPSVEVAAPTIASASNHGSPFGVGSVLLEVLLHLAVVAEECCGDDPVRMIRTPPPAVTGPDVVTDTLEPERSPARAGRMDLTLAPYALVHSVFHAGSGCRRPGGTSRAVVGSDAGGAGRVP